MPAFRLELWGSQQSFISLIFSPRRFGKTLLVKRIQAHLEKNGTLVLYADFFAVTSIDNETYFYQATLQALAPRQIALLRALKVEPSKTILSNRYISKHDLGSIGEVQSVLKKRRQMDLVEIGAESRYQVVAPIFGIWLCR